MMNMTIERWCSMGTYGDKGGIPWRRIVIDAHDATGYKIWYFA